MCSARLLSIVSFFILLALVGCNDHRETPSSGLPQLTDHVTGLQSPIGIAVDGKEQLWVSEIGDPEHGGRVSVIGADGQRHTAITGFSSMIHPQEGPSGLNHLLYKDGILYILHRLDGKLYKANIASFKPGDKPLTADQLERIDIGTFVRNYSFAADTEESNPYNLTFGPDGNLYIADAAANAIIKVTKVGEISVFATVPGIPNPTQAGPPTIEAVPTSIVFDGQKFLITTLLGFPFPTGKARIYQMDLTGKVSLYQEGFTSLVDIIMDADNKPIVVELGTFGQGFTPKTGRIVRASSDQPTVLVDKLTMPTAIERVNPMLYYIVSMGDGKVLKATY